MKQVRMPGLLRPVSAVALGIADLLSAEQAAPLFDAFVEAGGNLFDAAWIYRSGASEALLGDWLARRGVRESVAIIAKGAHTPHCTPEAIGRQLAESLARLRIERADIYMMHRDNPDVPVGEFVDAIADEAKAGRIASYGFSNWSLERVEDAVCHAADRGLPRPTSVSNNFSLAEMVEPVWPGCVSANGEAWRKRLSAGDLGLYAWSSQARGFFAERAQAAGGASLELVRCWYSEENLERRQRAAQLGKEHGRTANEIALAYVLHQNFPVVPLIGPLSLAELSASLGALEISLTPGEMTRLEG